MQSNLEKNLERFKKLYKMVKDLYVNFVIKITEKEKKLDTKDLVDIEKSLNDIIGFMDIYIH